MPAARYAVAALAALLLPLGPVAAQTSDCAVLALLGDPASDLSALTLHMRADGLIDVTAGAKDPLLAGAKKCELDGPADEFKLDCQWHSPTEAEGQARFAQMRAKIGQCLKGDFAPDPDPPGTGNLQKLQSYQGKVGADEDGFGGSDIALELDRYDFGDGDIDFWVELTASH